MPSISSLPQFAIDIILQFATSHYIDLIKLSGISHDWFQAAHKATLWRHLALNIKVPSYYVTEITGCLVCRSYCQPITMLPQFENSLIDFKVGEYRASTCTHSVISGFNPLYSMEAGIIPINAQSNNTPICIYQAFIDEFITLNKQWKYVADWHRYFRKLENFVTPLIPQLFACFGVVVVVSLGMISYGFNSADRYYLGFVWLDILVGTILLGNLFYIYYHAVIELRDYLFTGAFQFKLEGISALFHLLTYILIIGLLQSIYYNNSFNRNGGTSNTDRVTNWIAIAISMWCVTTVGNLFGLKALRSKYDSDDSVIIQISTQIALGMISYLPLSTITMFGHLYSHPEAFSPVYALVPLLPFSAMVVFTGLYAILLLITSIKNLCDGEESAYSSALIENWILFWSIVLLVSTTTHVMLLIVLYLRLSTIGIDMIGTSIQLSNFAIAPLLIFTFLFSMFSAFVIVIVLLCDDDN